MARETILTGYGPCNQWLNLIFDGDESKFEVWETKILGYMKLRKLKETGTDAVNNDKNETAFAEFVHIIHSIDGRLIHKETLQCSVINKMRNLKMHDLQYLNRHSLWDTMFVIYFLLEA